MGDAKHKFNAEFFILLSRLKKRLVIIIAFLINVKNLIFSLFLSCRQKSPKKL
jgi:hypothetical protein